MVIHLLVQKHHYDNGLPLGGAIDPIAIALREREELRSYDLCHVHPGHMVFTKNTKTYRAEFDSKKFHKHWQGIQRNITLKFREMDQNEFVD